MMLRLDIYGVKVSIEAASPAHAHLIPRLREDLGYFETSVADDLPEVRFLFASSSSLVSAGQLGRAIFSTRMCKVHGFGKHRVCDYGEGLRIASISEQRNRYFELTDPNLKGAGEEAYEVAYTTLLSAIGEALDLRGYHRVHALAFKRDGEGWLLVLPSGRGKSSICTLLLKDPSVRVLSDEMPLIRGSTIYPFPLRIALKPREAGILMPGVQGRVFQRRLYPTKILFPLSSAQVSGPIKASKILTTDSGGSSSIRTVTVLFSAMVVGLGLTQMTEYMLRLDSIPRLCFIAFLRLKTALLLVFRVGGKEFPDQDIQWLRELTARLQRTLRQSSEELSR